MPLQGIWLTFDLGVRGDYDSLYKWLDSRQAKDCGDNVAYVKFQFEANLIDELTTSLLSEIKTTPASRFYVIGRWDEKFRGKFIVGHRKPPVWAGFSPPQGAPPSDEA